MADVTYRQYDKRWSSLSYPAGDNMGDSGCGPTACANILANSIKPNCSPKDTRSFMLSIGAAIAGQGTTWDGITKCLQHFGCSVNVYTNISDAFKDLNKGHRYAIILFGSGTQNGVTWTGGGHFVAATGYKKENGQHKFYMRDSGGRKNDGWFTYETTMTKAFRRIWVITSTSKPSAFKTKAQKGSEGGDGGVIDDGGALILKDQIAKLYSSDNYDFIKREKVEEDKYDGLSASLSKDFKSAFNSINTVLTEKSANDPNLYDRIKKLNKTGALKDNDLEYHHPSNIGDTVLDTVWGKVSKNKGTLLVDDNIVQAPTIILNLNGVTIGGYGNSGDEYPNYIESMTVTKISGKINQYTINLLYTVRPNEDPNLIDKLLSRTGFTNKIEIIYGDSNNASGMFRDTEAIVTDVTFNENVNNHQIRYTISALSSIISPTSSNKTYGSKTDKASNLIRDIIYGTDIVSQSVLNSVPGMRNKSLVESKGLIPSDDKVITTKTRLNSSPLSQIAYLVSAMTDDFGNTYQLNIHDDTNNEFGGAYFSIDKLQANDTSTLSGGYFEVDVGYPDDTFVVSFNVTMDNYFPLVYEYNGNFTRWDYDIDNYGNLIQTKTNPLESNNIVNRKNVIQTNWWKKVTEYPVTATLTIRGLIKPIELMSYIKIRTLFYGTLDMSSGLYVVINQQDSINSNGVFTTLTLLRVGS